MRINKLDDVLGSGVRAGVNESKIKSLIEVVILLIFVCNQMLMINRLINVN